MNWLPQCEKVANKWKMKYFEETYRLLRQHLEGGADKIILLASEYVFNVSYVAFDVTALVGPVLGGKWVMPSERIRLSQLREIASSLAPCNAASSLSENCRANLA
jgi:hypothetical protein